jgi:hypothetical protein
LLAAEPPDIRARCGNLHSCHAQDRDESDLGLGIHLKVHHQPDRQESESKVGKDRKGTVGVSNVNDDINRDAGSVRVAYNASPEEVNRVALEQSDEEESDGGNDRKPERTVNDDSVRFDSSDSEEESRNRGLGQYHTRAVGEVAVPPVLNSCISILGFYQREHIRLETGIYHHGQSRVFGCESRHVLSGTVRYTQKTGSSVAGKRDLNNLFSCMLTTRRWIHLLQRIGDSPMPEPCTNHPVQTLW